MDTLTSLIRHLPRQTKGVCSLSLKTSVHEEVVARIIVILSAKTSCVAEQRVGGDVDGDGLFTIVKDAKAQSTGC